MSRGMKKFLPFASLKEQALFLAEMQQQKKRVEKPTLSEDQYAEINRVLSEYTGETVLIYYYNRGFIKTHQAKIKKIDTLYKRLVFTDLTVSFTNLLHIEII